MKVRVGHLVAALWLATLAAAQEVDLSWKPKVGDASTYKLRMEFTLFGDTAVYTAKVHDKVIEVNADSYTVETSQTEYKVEIFGEEGEVNDKDIPKAQTVFSLLGDVKEVRGDLTNDAAYRMANLTSIRRPGKPVKVGDSYERTVATDTKLGVPAAKGTYRVEAEERVGTEDAVVIGFEYAETEGGEPARCMGKYWLSKRDGKLLKSEATWSSAPIPGAPSPVNGTVTLERIDANL